jgi:CheY-like chemotaxis protein
MYRILVVDDDPFTVRIVEIHLRQHGYDVTCAGNGQEAWEVILQAPYDLIITDYSMPVLDGFALAGRVRANSMYRDIPIIVMSSQAPHLVVYEDLQQLRITALVPKPFSPTGLVELVHRSFRKPTSKSPSPA